MRKTLFFIFLFTLSLMNAQEAETVSAELYNKIVVEANGYKMEVEALENSVKEKEEALNEKDAEISDLRQQLEEKQKELDNTESARKEAQAQLGSIGELQKVLANRDKEIAKKSRDIASLESQIGALKKTNAELKDLGSECEAFVKQKRKEVDELYKKWVIGDQYSDETSENLLDELLQGISTYSQDGEQDPKFVKTKDLLAQIRHFKSLLEAGNKSNGGEYLNNTFSELNKIHSTNSGFNKRINDAKAELDKFCSDWNAGWIFFELNSDKYHLRETGNKLFKQDLESFIKEFKAERKVTDTDIIKKFEDYKPNHNNPFGEADLDCMKYKQ